MGKHASRAAYLLAYIDNLQAEQRENEQAVCQEIRKMRKQLKWSHGDLREKTGDSVAALERLESGSGYSRALAERVLTVMHTALAAHGQTG